MAAATATTSAMNPESRMTEIERLDKRSGSFISLLFPVAGRTPSHAPAARRQGAAPLAPLSVYYGSRQWLEPPSAPHPDRRTSYFASFRSQVFNSLAVEPRG